MSKKGQKFQKYDLEFKQKVLEYKEGYSASYLKMVYPRCDMEND